MDEYNKCQINEHEAELLSKSIKTSVIICNNMNSSSEVSSDNADADAAFYSVNNANIANSNIENASESVILSKETSKEKIDEKLQSRVPSLNDDSKLVKFSMPSNSMNLIQSNVQFLNKSRHLINFITEKSTNIMEKALLPQNLAVRNNNIDIKQSRIDNNSSQHHQINTLIKPDSIASVTCENKRIRENNENFDKNSLQSNIDDIPNQSVSSINTELSDDINNKIDNDIECQNNNIIKLKRRIKELERQNELLELQSDLSEIENRDMTIERLTNELRVAMVNQDEMRKELTIANKEKEDMVMKYAVGEKHLIEAQKAKDIGERKVKELLKDNEMLQNKLKQTLGERTRICGILDVKCRELTDAHKDIEKYKSEIEIREIKLKWTQNKLKSDMDLYKENNQKLEKAMVKINEMKDECDQVRRESQEAIHKFQKLEVNKAANLDEQLKEQQAQLILERHVTEDKEMSRLQLLKEVEVLKNQQESLIKENNTLSLKIQDLERDESIYKKNINQLKAISDERHKEIADLNSKLLNLETMKLELIHKNQCLTANEMELERLRKINQELQTDMDCCRQRETQMLDFTQKLTDKNVKLQSEFSAIESKANQLEIEQVPMRKCYNELNEKLRILENNLTIEKNKRIEECEILAKHVAEQTQLAQNLTQMLEDSKGENCVLKRKYQSSIKEMTRELQQCRKKLETYEMVSANNMFSDTSRASSDTSLNITNPQNGILSSDNNKTPEQPILYNDLDKNALIERILKMQRINVSRAEKLDFLEEHNRVLVSELQRKTKIIQNYILHENFDTMGNNERDKYKAELVRHGGIMASVYNHRVSDDNMTLELSLEINQKLQTVLEDALLKNITLKDSIDTLGGEIARLSIQNQQLQKATK